MKTDMWYWPMDEDSEKEMLKHILEAERLGKKVRTIMSTGFHYVVVFEDES